MENAFAWVRYVAEWVGQFVPRWVIVDTTQGWVKWVRGSKIVTGGAGIIWWWPAVTKISIYPVARQTTPLTTQTITTGDSETIAVSGMLVYEITDLEKILAHTYDPEDTVKDVAATALHDVLARMTWDDIRRGQGKTLDTKLKNEAKKELSDYGVRVIRFSLTTCAKTRVMRDIRSLFQEGEISTSVMAST